jgi:hypothetical protein
MTGEIKEAVRFVAREPHVRAIVATASINNLSRSIGVAVLLIYLSRQVGQGPYPNGRIFKLVLNENDPLKFDSLSILIDADTSLAGVPGVLHNPDNIETTANSIMIQEDPGSQNSFLPSNPAGTTARIWRYNLNTGALTVVANVNQSLTPNANLGAWESSGIVDVSEYFGPGAFLVDIQAHGVNVGPTRMIGSNLERMEGGQLLLIKVPGA